MRAGSLGLVVLATACGGGAAATPAPAAAPVAAPAPPADPLAGATVYDAAGTAVTCAAPRTDCPGAMPDRRFVDQCKLAGYQLRQCGCVELCSGNAAKANLHYDSAGNAKACPPAQDDCTPPDTSAEFQDACTDAHHRLEVCGCEWLCSGPPKP